MLPIRELMRHEIASVSPDAPVRRVVEIMVDRGVEEVLVVDGRGRVVGSVGDDRLSPAPTRAGVMLRRVFPVDPATSATSAVRLFDEYGVGVMPVVDHGVLIGVVFRGDLIKRLLLPYAFTAQRGRSEERRP